MKITNFLIFVNNTKTKTKLKAKNENEIKMNGILDLAKISDTKFGTYRPSGEY